MSNEEIIGKLHKALQAASEHLNYCGYGDSWERECAEGLEDQIDAALALVHAGLPSK